VSGLSPKPSRRLKTGHTILEALLVAKDLTQKNLFQIGDPEIANELAELGYPGEEAMLKALLTALGEVTPLDYRPPGQPEKIPEYRSFGVLNASKQACTSSLS
jgi:hypothetical protein